MTTEYHNEEAIRVLRASISKAREHADKITNSPNARLALEELSFAVEVLCNLEARRTLSARKQQQQARFEP